MQEKRAYFVIRSHKTDVTNYFSKFNLTEFYVKVLKSQKKTTTNFHMERFKSHEIV